MEKHYKKLMDNRKTLAARFIDALFLLLISTVVVFGYCIVTFRNMLSAAIIALNIDVIILLFMGKMQNIRINRFKKQMDAKIRDKLILEQIVLNKDDMIVIKGYRSLGKRYYISENGKKALMLRIYPESVLTPKELLEHITGHEEEIIASCAFDDDCRLMCSRMNIELKDKDFLLENVMIRIDDTQIEKEISAEVKKISEIKNKRKRTSFAAQRWSRYLLSCLLLFAVSGFMGRFKIIYIAFGGMCMSFCFISLLLSKSQ